MKKFIMAIVCLMTMVVSANAQKTSKFNYLDYQKTVTTIGDDTYVVFEKPKPTIELAGKYLKVSANFEIAAVTSAAVSGGLFALSANAKNESAEETYRGLAIVCGGIALACYIGKVAYKWKSGKTLEVCGTNIKYTF